MAKKVNMKAILKASPEYVAVIDWRAGVNRSRLFDFVDIEATDVIAAMDEASALFTEDVYLIQLIKKTCISTCDIAGIEYNAVLCSRRQCEWHPNNERNCEAAAKVIRHEYGHDFVF